MEEAIGNFWYFENKKLWVLISQRQNLEVQGLQTCLLNVTEQGRGGSYGILEGLK